MVYHKVGPKMSYHNLDRRKCPDLCSDFGRERCPVPRFPSPVRYV